MVDFISSLQRYGIPRYLKIDIEGMDKVCLNALTGFTHKPDYVSVESEKVEFDKLTAEVDLLVKLGYDQFKAVQQSGMFRRKEPNPSNEPPWEGKCIGYQFVQGSSGLFGSDLPSEWKNREEILKRYRPIFFKCRMFGDSGKLNKGALGGFLKKALRFLLRRPIPGWYDTHAKHRSVSTPISGQD
jgi:hypothetical protein